MTTNAQALMCPNPSHESAQAADCPVCRLYRGLTTLVPIEPPQTIADRSVPFAPVHPDQRSIGDELGDDWTDLSPESEAWAHATYSYGALGELEMPR